MQDKKWTHRIDKVGRFKLVHKQMDEGEEILSRIDITSMIWLFKYANAHTRICTQTAV